MWRARAASNPTPTRIPCQLSTPISWHASFIEGEADLVRRGRRAALGAGCAVAAVALVVLLAAREHHAERASLFSFGQAFPYITTPYSPQAR